MVRLADGAEAGGTARCLVRRPRPGHAESDLPRAAIAVLAGRAVRAARRILPAQRAAAGRQRADQGVSAVLQRYQELRKGKKAYKPFGYVNGENLKRLIICLTRENDSKKIALVVSYLKPEFVSEVLNALPQETQAKVAIEMATIHQMGQEQAHYLKAIMLLQEVQVII